MIDRKIIASNKELELSKIQPYFGKIYSDEMLLQRFLNEWDDNIATDHMVAFLDGHSNIYSLVLININSALDYSKDKLTNYLPEDNEYKNIKETVVYLQDKLDKNYEFLCVDGQHRINCYKRYLASEFALTKSVIANVPLGDSDSTVPFDLKGVLFKDFPAPVKDYILNNYTLLLTEIEKGTLENLVNVTIYTNLGEPWNKHEMRIILPSSFNQFVHNLLTDNPLLTKVFSEHATGMSGKDYLLKKKGDSRMICEWLGYLHNSRCGNIYDWPKDDMLDTMSSLEGLSGLTKKTLTEGQSLITKISDLVHADGKVTPIKRASLDNLFMLLSVFSNPNHPMNPYDKVVKINNPVDYYDWFMKTDVKLRKKDAFVIDPNTNKVMVNPTTNTKLKNSESFSSKCGAKKVDDIKLRITELTTEFTKGYNKLFGDGVVTLIDKDVKFTKSQKEDVALESNWKSIDGDNLKHSDIFSKTPTVDGDHGIVQDSGGSSKTDNLLLRKAGANRRKNKKTEAFKS